MLQKENIKVEIGKIPNGTDDIARFLGLKPEKTIFMHSTAFDESDSDNIKRRAINKGRMIFAEPLSYSSNKENGSKTAIAYFNEELLNKFEEIGILKTENILRVSDVRNVDYPNNCVSDLLNQKVKKDINFKNSIENYTIVSSYLSKEDEETARLINGNLIMDRKNQVKFNSKYDFRLMSEKYNFNIPDGICIKGIDQLDDKLRLFEEKKDKAKNLWIKLESQSSGTGNIEINNYKQTSIKEIKEKIIEVASKIFDYEYIKKEMQFIVETDVNIEGFKEVANIGVEAVIAEKKVTVLGGVEQETLNGKYLGSKYDNCTDIYMDKAIECAIEAFKAVSIEGYRGFMTIDVLVTKNEETNEIKTYNIDPNARFSAGTMLLKNIHTSEQHNNKKMYGFSFSNIIPKTEDTIKTLLELLGNNIYNYYGNYTGIIPAIINDLNEIGENQYYLKTIVIDFSYEKALEKYNNFKESIRKLSKE